MGNGTRGTDGSLSYVLDAEDRIESVDERWHEFAAANGAPALTAAVVLGRPLHAFISDSTTAHLNRVILARARGGSVLTFPFRCDAPGLRREMRMELSPEPRGRVRCVTTLAAARPVPRPRSAATGAPRLLTMCSWCNRIRLGDRWYEVTDAVGGARLFLAPAPSEITHGMCRRCEDAMNPEGGLVPA